MKCMIAQNVISVCVSRSLSVLFQYSMFFALLMCNRHRRHDICWASPSHRTTLCTMQFAFCACCICVSNVNPRCSFTQSGDNEHFEGKFSIYFVAVLDVLVKTMFLQVNVTRDDETLCKNPNCRRIEENLILLMMLN